MRHTVMLYVVGSTKDELTVSTVNDILGTLFIIVLPQLSHCSQILRAKGTVVMLQLVRIVVRIVDILVAVGAANDQLGKQVFRHP